MLKALAWKEWREQRPLVLTGLGVSAVLPLFMMAGMMATTANRNFSNIIDIMGLALLFFVWPLIAAATGATAPTWRMTACASCCRVRSRRRGCGASRWPSGWRHFSPSSPVAS